MQVRDVNFEAKTVAILRAWKKGAGSQRVLGKPKSHRSRRYVMVPDWAIDVMRQCAEGKARDDLLFYGWLVVVVVLARSLVLRLLVVDLVLRWL